MKHLLQFWNPICIFDFNNNQLDKKKKKKKKKKKNIELVMAILCWNR